MGVGCRALLQGIFLDRIEPASLMSPALAGGFFTTSATWEAHPTSYMVANCWPCLQNLFRIQLLLGTPHLCHLLQPTGLCLLATTNLLSVPMDWFTLDMKSYNIWPLVPGFFHEALCSQNPSMLYHGSVLHLFDCRISHCMDIPRFDYSFIIWWTRGCFHFSALWHFWHYE